jgi:hypothetical protein
MPPFDFWQKEGRMPDTSKKEDISYAGRTINLMRLRKDFHSGFLFAKAKRRRLTP